MDRFLTSRQWLDFYQANSLDRLPIPWELGAELSSEEARAIIVSLQAWQLGETSEGVHFLAAARRYAAATGDPEFLKVVRCFIVEEQRHGELLGRFLDLHGAGRIRRNWADSIFRKMRNCLTNMEIWTTVVIIVETFALVYYRAVMLSTGSRVLQTICRQILKDEVYHLRFQYERLAQMYVEHSAFRMWLTMAIQRVLFVGTAAAVWVGHHRALKAGGYPLRRFWRSAWNRMSFHWRQMHAMRSTNPDTSWQISIPREPKSKVGIDHVKPSSGTGPVSLLLSGPARSSSLPATGRFLDSHSSSHGDIVGAGPD